MSEEKSLATTGSKSMAKEKKHRNRPDLAKFGQENIKPGDNARYLGHALKMWNLPALDLDDDAAVEERIGWYFQHCQEDDMKPTVNGLAMALGISRQTLHKWSTGQLRGEKSDRSDLIKRAYGMLQLLWEDYMLNGKVNPVSGIFLGKNHFDYTDKQEVTLTPGTPLGEPVDPAALEEKYADVVVEEVLDDKF